MSSMRGENDTEPGQNGEVCPVQYPKREAKAKSSSHFVLVFGAKTLAARQLACRQLGLSRSPKRRTSKVGGLYLAPESQMKVAAK